MAWAGIKILCIILVAGSQLLVYGNTDFEDDKDNEYNIEDTLDEAENEKNPIQDNLDKDVPNETEAEKIDIKDDLNDNGDLIYDEDGNILVEVEDYSYENEDDHSANIKDDNSVADTLDENEYSVGDLIYDEDGNILDEDEPNSYENKDEHLDKKENAVADIKYDKYGDIIEKDEHSSYEHEDYYLDKAVYADEDVIYDEDGNIKDDDEFYSYEEDDEFLDVSEVENIGSVLTRAGKSLKENGVGEVKHDDGNVLDDEDDYSYETEDDFTEICPDDYVGIESECFQMSSKSLDWDKASATCEENSGHLASLKHPMALREYIIKHYPKASFWVGGRHIRNPDGWQWISGNRFSPHFPWATHNRVPKKNKGECIILRYFPKQGEPEYVDNKCTRKTRFICERQKVKLDLEKKSITGEHTEQILDTVVSSEEKTDHEKKPDIGTPTPQILEKPTSDDLKLMLSG